MLNFIKRIFKKKVARRCGWVNVYKAPNGSTRLSGGHVYGSRNKALKARKESKSKGVLSEFIGTAKVYYVIEVKK